MTSEDGSLIMKPALPIEVAFYQVVLTDPSLAPIRPFIPKFYGTLRLEGQVDEEQSAFGHIALKQESATAVKEEERESIVLENLSHTFLKPNILDIKLGTVLYDEDASDEKRARMEKAARTSTSGETGIRLTGWQVYDLEANKAMTMPRSYGRTIKPADLPEGIAMFFPVASSSSSAASTYLSVPAATAGATRGTGLPADVLLPVLEGLREDVAEIRTALSNVHVRMVGASLLIVYEADTERAREGVRLWLQGEGSSEGEDDDSDDDDDEANGQTRPGPPYAVKIIDFAHTRLKPGQGPDEGVLKGLDTVLRLLDGRIEQVKGLQVESA